MGKKRHRDVETVYSTSEFVSKLRRLADALETGKRFEIQVAGERVYVPARAEFNVEHKRKGSEEEIVLPTLHAKVALPTCLCP